MLYHKLGESHNTNFTNFPKLTLPNRSNAFEGGSGWIGNATLNGGAINNKGTIDEMTYNAGRFNQSGAGSVGSLTVNGNAAGIDFGNLETANVTGGILYNGVGGSGGRGGDGGSTLFSGRAGTNGIDNTNAITTANLYNGTLYNGRGGYAGDGGSGGNTNLDGWSNGGIGGTGGTGTGVIATANVYGGTLHNGIGGFGGNGGNGGSWWMNDGGDGGTGGTGKGIITTANVYGGTVYNSSNNGPVGSNGDGGDGGWNMFNGRGGFGGRGGEGIGTIGTMNLFNGSVYNAGTIDNLNYTGGSYYRGDNGSIGTLNVAGDSRGIDWGTVGSLEFSSNGDGYMTISAFAEDGIPGFTSSINAQNVDLTYGNLALDMSGLGEFDSVYASSLFADGIAFGDLFGASEIMGMADSIAVTWDDWFFSIFEDNAFASGWNWDTTNALLSWDGSTIAWKNSSVPEPATLAIIGLGLAGLGLARRRRK